MDSVDAIPLSVASVESASTTIASNRKLVAVILFVAALLCFAFQVGIWYASHFGDLHYSVSNIIAETLPVLGALLIAGERVLRSAQRSLARRLAASDTTLSWFLKGRLVFAVDSLDALRTESSFKVNARVCDALVARRLSGR